MDLRFLFLDLNSYFASVEQQLRPELRGKPVIVVPVMTDYTSAIAASYEAKALGIKTGTMVKDAKQICPGLKIVLADHKAYVDYHHRIHAAVEENIPVSVIASIDEFGCELMANERDPDTATEIAYAIKETLKKRVGHHIRASIGIAPNRYLAKIACDMRKPDGLTLLEAPTMMARLSKLELRDLPGVGPNMEARLHMAGIKTMKQLLALEPKHLRRIWNSVAGEQLYYRLRGIEIAEPPTNRSTVGHSHVLAPKWRPAAMAFTVAQRMMLKAGSRLRRIDYLARAMDLSVRTEDRGRFSYSITFPPACDNHQFLQMLGQLWETMLRDARPHRLKKISITLHHLVAAADAVPTLFDAIDAGKPHNPKRLAELSRTMDRINARFGRDAVVMGFTPDTIQEFSGPKIAFSRVPEYEEFHE